MGMWAPLACVCYVYRVRLLHDISRQKLYVKKRREKANSQSNESREERWDCSWLWVWQQMFYMNPTRCSQSVSMATESVIIEPGSSPLLSPNKVEADEYEPSPAHHQLFLLLLPLFLLFLVPYKYWVVPRKGAVSLLMNEHRALKLNEVIVFSCDTIREKLFLEKPMISEDAK